MGCLLGKQPPPPIGESYKYNVSANNPTEGQVQRAPSAINETHLRVVKLRILLFEMGTATLVEEMEKCIKKEGCRGWKPWLAQNEVAVSSYPFFGQTRAQFFPEPMPSSWDITFLAFLCRKRILDFPKRNAVMELNDIRNKLSHDINATIDLTRFERFWCSISGALLSLIDETLQSQLREQIDRVKSLKVIREDESNASLMHSTTEGQQSRSQQQQHQHNTSNAVAADRLVQQRHEDLCLCQDCQPSFFSGSNNNHEIPRRQTQLTIPCWRCELPRVYTIKFSGNSNCSVEATASEMRY